LLTDAGQTLLAPMSQALGLMVEAVASIEGDDAAGMLTVSTLGSIAANWLVPRLGRFRASHPDIEVRIAISDDLVDFSEGGVDVALRYGMGDYPGLRVVPMMTEDLFPVCSPGMLEGGPPLNEPADLRHYTLFHDNMSEGWPEWFAAAGVSGGEFTHAPVFPHFHLVVRSAIIGDGVGTQRSCFANGIKNWRNQFPLGFSQATGPRAFVAGAGPHDSLQVRPGVMGENSEVARGGLMMLKRDA